MQGTVKFFNDSKGYGFITEDESKKDYFVHSTGLRDKVQNNDKVTFEVTDGKRGPMAVEVKVIR
jgi:CspA family cold shock protein